MTDQRRTRQLHRWIGVLVLAVTAATAAPAAMAGCNTVSFTPTGVDVGTKGYAPLPTWSESAAYKLAGTGAVTLRAQCDDTPDNRQLTLDTIATADTPGLLRWNLVGGSSTAGAVKLTVQQATVGGSPVAMTFTPNGGTTTAATQGPLVITGPGVLTVDQRAISASGDARKTLLVNLQIQTLLKSSGFAPTGATPFRLDMGASLP